MFFVSPSCPIGKAGKRAVCRLVRNRTRWSDGSNQLLQPVPLWCHQFSFLSFLLHVLQS